jgi:hypothetical protein
MVRLRKAALILAAAILAAAALSCATVPPPARHRVRVTGIDIGRSLDINDRVSRRTSAFDAADAAVYLSVRLVGPAYAASLRTRWIGSGGQVLDDETMPHIRLSPHEELTVPCKISKEGWPPGTYRVEVFLNDFEAGEKSFHVTGETRLAGSTGGGVSATR